MGVAQKFGGAAGTLVAPALVFLLVVGIGAATSYVRTSPEPAVSRDAASSPPSPSGSDDDALVRLADYAGSIGAKNPASAAAAGRTLPDVSTMIERLAARLESTPEDMAGWRMLGWSYFNIGRHQEAADAYAKAMALDPSSAELKQAYEEAKAKAASGDASGAASTSSAETAAGRGGEPKPKQVATSETTPPNVGDAQIRSMVDGLAARLENSPQDVEGWMRLMRSRVVLGEKEVAAQALRKALEVFKDDADASGKISAAAVDLGLKAE